MLESFWLVLTSAHQSKKHYIRLSIIEPFIKNDLIKWIGDCAAVHRVDVCISNYELHECIEPWHQHLISLILDSCFFYIGFVASDECGGECKVIDGMVDLIDIHILWNRTDRWSLAFANVQIGF